MQISALVGTVDLGIQTHWMILLLGLAGQQGKKKVQFSARKFHTAL
jgi:hypothetical protein